MNDFDICLRAIQCMTKFLEKNDFFFKKDQFVYDLKNPTISVAVYGQKVLKLRIGHYRKSNNIKWQKNVQFQQCWMDEFLSTFMFRRKIFEVWLSPKTAMGNLER